jgi:transposase
MKKQVTLRPLSEAETEQVNKLVRSRTAETRLVQRARIIKAMLDDPQLSATKAGEAAGFRTPGVGSKWVRRFNELGVDGLSDLPRPGRPETHAEDIRSKVIELARKKPRSMGRPFELWTLARLQVAFQEREGVHLSRSTIWEWLDNEGLEWKRQESWFEDSEHQDPEFVPKRGR